MADQNRQKLSFPCYELWHAYNEQPEKYSFIRKVFYLPRLQNLVKHTKKFSNLPGYPDDINFQPRVLSHKERQSMEAKLASMLQDWQPKPSFSKLSFSDLSSKFLNKTLHNYSYMDFAINMFLDKQAQAIMNVKRDNPYPFSAVLRIFPLPGKTLFSCSVIVDELCGVVCRGQYAGKDPLEVRATFARDKIAHIDALFDGESLDVHQLRIAMYQFGEYHVFW